MLTPAITASSTSEPPVIIWKAFWTAVTLPPFLKRLPFAEAITIGLTVLCFRIVGKTGIAMPAAALLRMKSRRFILLMVSSFYQEWGHRLTRMTPIRKELP